MLLSASVTVPSSINSPDSELTIVSSLNAYAASFEPYDGMISSGAAGVYDDAKCNFKAIRYLYKYDKVTVSEEKNGYGRINQNKQEWVDLDCIAYDAIVKSSTVKVFNGSGEYVRSLSKGANVTIYQVMDGKGRITDTQNNVFSEFMSMMPYTYYGEWISIDSVQKTTRTSNINNNPTDTVPMYKVTAKNGLNIRNEKGAIIGSLQYNETVYNYGEKFENNNPWIKIDPKEERWACSNYLEKITNTDGSNKTTTSDSNNSPKTTTTTTVTKFPYKAKVVNNSAGIKVQPDEQLKPVYSLGKNTEVNITKHDSTGKWGQIDNNV